MIKVLVVETTKCGYDGITNVIKNYFLYQEDPEIQMDLVTINEAVPELKTFLVRHVDAQTSRYEGNTS